ncbi:DUF2644 domain-containing protein [Conservatibacter flavescens]|uniref:DUF2644 domain-containing protein n=1 Tax=Conservatibacter flavescens TaxID=28161 RepID=A0A2M8S4X6_9PAST|nr:DUF2644 domain-containing protein [Conservatibacter flavescens]PJG86200.1 hypothetical protein CVP05_03245 [Conservatibacter flavescens]
MKLKELITNTDGRLSTTGFIQFFSWAVATGLLIWSHLEGKTFASEYWVLYVSLCVFGSPVTKGVVSKFNPKTREERK